MSATTSRMAFPVAEYERRLALTRGWMAEEGLDLLILTQPEHYNWLSGFDPTAIFYFQALLVPAGNDKPLTLICNRAEQGLCEETCYVEDVEIVWTYEDQVARALQIMIDRGLLDQARRIGMMPGKAVPRLQESIPIDLRPRERVPQVRCDVLAWDKGQRCLAVESRHEIARQQNDRQ